MFKKSNEQILNYIKLIVQMGYESISNVSFWHLKIIEANKTHDKLTCQFHKYLLDVILDITKV